MDKSDPAAHQRLVEILDQETKARGLTYHHLRHRSLGDAHSVEVHLLFPAGASLAQAHRLATEIEQAVKNKLEPYAYVSTHLECASDHKALHPAEIPDQSGN